MSGPTGPKLIDVDANLLHQALQSDKDVLMDSATRVGVTRFVVPGSTLADSAAAIHLAATQPTVVLATAGVHPYHAHSNPSTAELEQLEILARNPLCRAIGECGLDTSEGFPALEPQLAWLEAQVSLACKLKKPLFLHQRGAFDAFNAILESHELPPVLVHCFTGTQAELSYFVHRGYSISLSGFVYRKEFVKEHASSLAATLPLDRVMVETDSPYMGFKVRVNAHMYVDNHCQNCRKTCEVKRSSKYPNVPASLPRVLAKVAELMGKDEATLSQATTNNAAIFFGLHLVQEQVRNE